MITKLIHLQCIARAQNCLTSMFVKGGQISEREAKFPRKYGPRGGAYFLGNLARGDHILGGANFLGHRKRLNISRKNCIILNNCKHN